MTGGRQHWSFRRSRWLGVKHVRSLGSEEDLVSGQLFRTDSTSANKVARPSSLNVCSFTKPNMTCRVDLMKRSQVPPWCDAPGALKRQVMFLCKRKDSIWLSFHCRMASRSSLSAPTRFVPLSDPIICTCPWRAIKRRRTSIKASVSNEADISRWTALETKQVKRAPYLFTVLRPRLTIIGPK